MKKHFIGNKNYPGIWLKGSNKKWGECVQRVDENNEVPQVEKSTTCEAVLMLRVSCIYRTFFFHYCMIQWFHIKFVFFTNWLTRVEFPFFVHYILLLISLAIMKYPQCNITLIMNNLLRIFKTQNFPQQSSSIGIDKCWMKWLCVYARSHSCSQ